MVLEYKTTELHVHNMIAMKIIMTLKTLFIYYSFHNHDSEYKVNNYNHLISHI